jgi:hypothetical protein
MSTELAKRTTTDIVRDGAFDLTPHSLNEAIQLAEYMCKSALVPTQYRDRPADVLIAVQYGQEVGLPPLQAIQGIAVVNGRPVLWGDAALAVVQKSGMMENYKEMTADEIEKAGKAVFWAKRKGLAEPIVREFSIENAKKAGLWGKAGVWQQYPYRMLQMRARSWGLRDGFADALKGISIREEIEDVAPVEAPRVLAMPRRMSEKQIEAPVVQQEPISETSPPPFEPAFDPPAENPSGPTGCPKCSSPLKFHEEGKWGPWWSCSTYPNCDGKISKSKWDKEHPHNLGD